MALPLPVLDDRGFQELVDGMRERLPRIAPDWTDHNASDPGITLLELLAYQGDLLSYRFDRIPPRRAYRARVQSRRPNGGGGGALARGVAFR